MAMRRSCLPHRVQENIFQRIAAIIQTPDADILLRGEAVDVANLDAGRENHFQARRAKCCALAAHSAEPSAETNSRADDFHFEEEAIRCALFLKIDNARDTAVAENHHLVASLLDVVKQMRGEQQVSVASLANFANQADQALAPRRIEAVAGFVENQQARAVHDGLSELGELLHAERIGSELAIARFAQTNVDKGVMSALEGQVGREAGNFGHVAYEANAGRARNERVILRHVADQGSQPTARAANVQAQNASRAAGGRVESEQGVDQRRLSRAIRAEQADRPRVHLSFEAVKNLAATEVNFQPA